MNTAPTIQEPKTASSKRSISIPEIALQELKTHKAKQNRLKLLYGEAYCDHGLVCPRPDGNPMDPRGLNEHFENCIQKSGLPKIRFHDLRHTHATLMLQLGQHPKVVSERLGHANVNITMNTYSHVMPNMQSDAAKKFNEAFKNIGD
jgi:integrase